MNEHILYFIFISVVPEHTQTRHPATPNKFKARSSAWSSGQKPILAEIESGWMETGIHTDSDRSESQMNQTKVKSWSSAVRV